MRPVPFPGLLLPVLCALAPAVAQDAEVADPRAAALALPLPGLRLADLDRWRTHVVPTEAETRYAGIDWIPSFSEGLVAASRRGRPLLLWAMNGHPLGCT